MIQYFAVIDTETTTISYVYKTDIGQYDLQKSNLVQIEVNEDFDKDIYIVEKTGETYDLKIDEIKKKEKEIDKKNQLKNNVMYQIRSIRNHMLSGTDWSRLDDIIISDDKKEKIRIYRQKLRDFPSTLSEEDILNYPKIPLKWPTID